jgi:hypothetical protein
VVGGAGNHSQAPRSRSWQGSSALKDHRNDLAGPCALFTNPQLHKAVIESSRLQVPDALFHTGISSSHLSSLCTDSKHRVHTHSEHLKRHQSLRAHHHHRQHHVCLLSATFFRCVRRLQLARRVCPCSRGYFFSPRRPRSG